MEAKASCQEPSVTMSARVHVSNMIIYSKLFRVATK